jgi:hypothetical protein
MGRREPATVARAVLLSPRLVTALAVGAVMWAAVTWALILSFASAGASSEAGVGFGLAPGADAEIAALSAELRTLRETLDALSASGGIAPASAFGAFAAPGDPPPDLGEAAVASGELPAPPDAEPATAAPEPDIETIYPPLMDLLAPDEPFRWWENSVPEVLRDFDGPIVTDGSDLYSCHHFDSWEQAQALYEANLPGDPNRIDGDSNGIACEKLRR